MRIKIIFLLFVGLLISSIRCVNGEIKGSGLEFEELIPRDEFNPQKLGIVKGYVKDILQLPKTNGFGNIIVAIFETAQGKVYAVLGPDWYMKNQEFEIVKDQYLVVYGSKIDYQDKNIVIGTELKSRGKILKLRDRENGNSEWHEWRRGDEIFYKNYNR